MTGTADAHRYKRETPPQPINTTYRATGPSPEVRVRPKPTTTLLQPMPLPAGADPSAIRQLLLQHTFLPLVSVHASRAADAHFQTQCQDPLVSALQVLRPYGNNARYGVANQGYKITNTLLITRTYGLFPVRFEPPLPELLTVHNPSDDKLRSLFCVLLLELLMQEAAQSDRPGSLLYTTMFRKIITSNRVVLFDTLNHPVAQVFVVAFGADTLESLRSLIVEFRNFNFPRYFQTADLLVHVFVLYDSQSAHDSDLGRFVDLIRSLSVSATIVPTNAPLETAVRISATENATIDEDLQRMSLGEADYISVPKSLDHSLRTRIHDFISRLLVPHMERKIRTWDDQVLGPKKSLTGRFFSVSRKIFNSNSNDADQQASVYNHSGSYYHRSSPEQALRKLADWSLMLKDFKYAYSTYDLIKKDYINDKAWVYVAAAQEMCVVSLLLAQTQPLASDVMPQAPNKNTLRKIRHDIIEPYIDNLAYTFKSRLNVKTYAIKAHLVVAELLLNMSMMFNLLAWWADLIERYLLSCMASLAHTESAGELPQVTRAILYERMAYSTGRSIFVPGDYQGELEKFLAKQILEEKKSSKKEAPSNNANEAETELPGEEGPIKQTQDPTRKENTGEDKNSIYMKGGAKESSENGSDQCFVNIHKMPVPPDNSIKGLTRFRKSSLWYVLAMREWVTLKNNAQAKRLLEDIVPRYKAANSYDWHDRKDLILAGIKATVAKSTEVH